MIKVLGEMVRWDPKRFEPFFRDFDVLGKRFGNWFDREFPETEIFGAWQPMVDIYDHANEIVLHAELPGMKKEDVHVEVENNMLTLRGERKREEKVEKGEFYRRERVYGAFTRSFSLPATVNPEKIQANYKDGILTVRLPKVEKAKPKQIEIKV
ncbi:MAG TPA: Hsp20/alpha crystallin family protein [Vicinamibacteria bacterium]|nr:Hsp20/alpha crystallin family protein [Vicinamibacteria bacterium]